MKTISLLISMLTVGLVAGFSMSVAADQIKVYSVEKDAYIMTEKVHKKPEEWPVTDSRGVLHPARKRHRAGFHRQV